ncbi:type II secretion system ATPase GspE [Candidatus Babeliales bacterium]|nr:type II secretion system ATPase GspE [Candidatus Babeliales bacterium]MCF7899498.1 type II secretion system ATPase GspE [Candidatus Babeliales bacterium]
MSRKKIGEILIEQGVITNEQLRLCLQEQETNKILLGQILIQHSFATPKDISMALARQISTPFIEKITEQMVDPKLLGKVPLKFLRQNIVIPVLFEGKKTIVTSNPRDLEPLDNLALLMGGDVTYAVSTPGAISDAINRYYPLESSKEMMEELKETESKEEIDLGEIAEEKDILEMANDAPIIKLVNRMLFQAVKEDASDIHIEPFEKELRVRYRIDGTMYQRFSPPKRYQGAIISRVKIMAQLNIAEKRLPQDGRIQIKVGDKAIDIRVSILPCSFGERVVMRLLDKTKGVLELEALNFSERDYKIITKMISQPNGIILVSGPTGSGKTTTLYSILNRLNQSDINIITVEDPVEYTIKGVNQVQVKEDIGLTFAASLRSILRQDPDIVLIGEIRDVETAQISTQAALTGHLVLSTIHTNSAPATITRLIDMGVEPFLIASSLACVMSQRLVRKLCDKCKQAYSPDPDMISRVGLTKDQAKDITFYKPVGCDECINTGYKGRLAIFEIMEITDKIAHLIVEKADATIIKREALKDGMTTLGMDGLRYIKSGLTSIEEVLSVAYVEEAIEEF